MLLPTAFDLDLWQAGGLTSFSQTPFAEHWATLPSIVVENGDGRKTASIPVDAYDFRHRMALVRNLIECEEMGGEAVWGKDFAEHWLWAYLSMLDWQRRSGRFEDPATWEDVVVLPPEPFDHTQTSQGDKGHSYAISKNSWWGYMNCNLSVGVYCGAAEAGLVPPIELSDPSVGVDPGFRINVGIWKEWWATDHAEFVAVCLALEGEDDDNDEKTKRNKKKLAYRKLYESVWRIHTDIINVGVEHSKGLQARLPREDLDVGLGWCNMLEFLSATNWPLLSLESLYTFGCGYLPTLRLAGPNTVEWLRQNRDFEHRTVQSLHTLVRTSPKARGLFCAFFGRLSRWEFARNKLPTTLHVLTHGNPLRKCLALTRAMVLAAVPRRVSEVALTAAAAVVGTLMAQSSRRVLLLRN